MSNFGFLHLRVVNPFELAFREARSAVGAAPLLAQTEEFKSLDEAVADCSLVVGTTALSRRDPQHTVRDLQQGARLIRKHLRGGRVALLFGSENLGQAVAVCLYELARDGKSASARSATQESARAAAGDLERVEALLCEVLGA